MFEGIPIISIILLMPIIGSILTFSLGRRESWAKWFALSFSLAALVLSVVVALQFMVDPTSQATGYHDGSKFFNYQFYEEHVWIKALGINYIVGLDGISLPLFVLTTLLCTLSVVFSWDTKVRARSTSD